MKQIVFSGYLADMYPDGIQVEGDSAAECISALANFPGFRESDGVQHTVMLPDFQSRDALYSRTSLKSISVVPIVVGAGGSDFGTFLMIALGAVLIATGLGAAVGTQLVLGGLMTAATATSLGVMLLLNGVIALLTPQPEMSQYGDGEPKSDYLAANQNTVKMGTRIPLLFGRRRVFGQVLSFNITAGNKPSAEPVIDYDALNDFNWNFASDNGYAGQSNGPPPWNDDGTGGGGA